MKSKLVSRNPILRFKLGKSIIKAALGVKTSEPTRGTAIGDYMRKQTSRGYIWQNKKDNSIIQPGLEMLVNGNYLKGDGSYISASLRKNPLNTPELKILEGRVLPELVVIGHKKNKNLVPIKKTPSTFFGVQAGGLVNNNALSQITADLRAKLIGTGNFTDADFANVRNLLGALNRYFSKDGAGSIKEDNLWGNQTLKAFNMALNKANVPVLGGNSAILKITPTIEAPATIDYKPIYNINNLNRSQTRNLMRAAGYNPYNFTGDLRKALRLYLNGLSNDTSKLEGIDLTKFNVNPYERIPASKWTPQGGDWRSNLLKTLNLSYNPSTLFKTNFRSVAQ